MEPKEASCGLHTQEVNLLEGVICPITESAGAEQLLPWQGIEIG